MIAYNPPPIRPATACRSREVRRHLSPCCAGALTCESPGCPDAAGADRSPPEPAAVADTRSRRESRDRMPSCDFRADVRLRFPGRLSGQGSGDRRGGGRRAASCGDRRGRACFPGVSRNPSGTPCMATDAGECGRTRGLRREAQERGRWRKIGYSRRRLGDPAPSAMRSAEPAGMPRPQGQRHPHTIPAFVSIRAYSAGMCDRSP